MQGRCLHQDHLPEFIGRLQALRAHCLPRRPRGLVVSLSFKLLEIIRHQDLTSRRANFHVHVTPGQQLLCVLQRFCSLGMTNIDPRELITPADQELQLLGLSHARQPRRGERSGAVPARSPAAQSSRSDEIGPLRAPLSSARGLVDPRSPMDAGGKRGDRRRYAHSSPIASAKVKQGSIISKAMP